LVNSSLLQLEEILERYIDYYQSLVSLSREEQLLLIKGDVKNFSNLAEKKQELIDKIRSAEAERISLMNSISGDFHCSAGILTLSKLVELLDEPLASNYRQLHINLLQTMKESHVLNEQNASLLRNSFEYTNYLLSLFTGEGNKNDAIYTSSAVRNKKDRKILDQNV